MSSRSVFLFCLEMGLASCQLRADVPIVDTWKMSLQKPAADWRSVDFDDSSWKEAAGGFGTRGTPGSRIGTTWRSNDIWLRKVFELKKLPAKPALLIHHDEDVQVFLNGQQVLALEGWKTEYVVQPLDAATRKLLLVGSNLLAVHCKQTNGGQFIDVHLVDGDKVPELPRPKRSTKPFRSELLTKWGAEVSAENAWTEYPRPLLVRDAWQNLNGNWQYAVTSKEQTEAPSEWAGEILVPFCLESRLGGVGRLLDASEALWYRREFSVERSPSQRVLLHFEAVDYRSRVSVNGRSVGEHRGGHTPFSFDITDALRDGSNTLVVRVEDETEGWQLRGKQVLEAHGIWYTQVSGIWQTVWLEPVPGSSIRDLDISTNAEKGSISVQPEVVGDHGGLEVIVRDGDRIVARQLGTDEVSLQVEDAKLWSPASPHLYDLEVRLLDGIGKVIDVVRSYTGIRTVGKVRDADGHLRFTLNGETIFHWGPLDQGWWPDGLLTPPSDEAMLFDIEYLRSAGFNMIRKHIKVEPRRYYWHCDRLGMLVWQDQVSAGHNAPWTRLKPKPKDAEWPDEHQAQYLLEHERMVGTLESHPSIVVWVPFNEAWGQHRTVEVGKWIAERDPSRLVNIASGGNFWPVGDIVDAHSYPQPGFPFDPERYRDFIKVIGEFGGHGYPVAGHLWDANRRNWGYGGLPKTRGEYRERYVKTLRMLDELQSRGIAAGVYTQTTDVEGEINGLLTYDRKVAKIPAAELAEMHRVLFDEDE